jgi:hypothetical protein
LERRQRKRELWRSPLTSKMLESFLQGDVGSLVLAARVPVISAYQLQPTPLSTNAELIFAPRRHFGVKCARVQ